MNTKPKSGYPARGTWAMLLVVVTIAGVSCFYRTPPSSTSRDSFDWGFTGDGRFFNSSDRCDLMRFTGSETNVAIPVKVRFHASTRKWLGADFFRRMGIKRFTKYFPVTEIQTGAFQGCEKLQSVRIPESVNSIGRYAFAFCASLRSIEIPASVTRIEPDAFAFCTTLEFVTIANPATRIDPTAFEGCPNLTLIHK